MAMFNSKLLVYQRVNLFFFQFSYKAKWYGNNQPASSSGVALGHTGEISHRFRWAARQVAS
jgi:hypothetical protein